MKVYKVQMMQHLKPIAYPYRNIILSNKADFHHEGYINKKNAASSTQNPHVIVEKPMYPHLCSKMMKMTP